MSWSVLTRTSLPMSSSGSRPTEACSWRPWWRPATGSTPSTRCRRRAYRDRHSSSGAKSDAGDAQVLSDMVRTDRHNHRLMAGDSEEVEAIKILARAHQSMVWSRGRQTNLLRSTLREFYPAALVAFDNLASGDALEVLRIAPTPTLGGACRARRLPRLCVGAVANGASTSGRPRSRAHCAPSSSRRPRPWPTPWELGVRQRGGHRRDGRPDHPAGRGARSGF